MRRDCSSVGKAVCSLAEQRDSSPNSTPSSAPRELIRLHRLSFVLLSIFLLAIVLILPFAFTSLLAYVVRPQSSHIYPLIDESIEPASNHARLHLDVLSLDEWSRTVDVRVAGSHICQTACSQTDQVTFVASPESGDVAEGLPPSDGVSFPPNGTRVTQTITLPVVGQPILFPFDTYRLGLGVMFESIPPEGRPRVLNAKESQGHLFLTLQTHVVRTVMTTPTANSANDLGLSAPGAQYVGAWSLTFSRPLHLKILTVFLLLLVIVAAIYAVFLRPLSELAINAGALVLGVWGIRSILLGTSPPGATLVDLTLSMVILFLLFAIVARALWFHRARGAVHLRKGSSVPPPDPPG